MPRPNRGKSAEQNRSNELSLRESRGYLCYCTTRSHSASRFAPPLFPRNFSRTGASRTILGGAKASRPERFIATFSPRSRRGYRGSQARDPAINPERSERCFRLRSATPRRRLHLRRSLPFSRFARHVLARERRPARSTSRGPEDLARGELLRGAFRDIGGPRTSPSH